VVNRCPSPAAFGLGTARTRPVALSIAGSDAGGGAGVAADIKTFEAHGVWATLAVTAVTAQNTLGVQTREVMSPEMVRAQMASVVVDIGVDAAKTGMLAHSGMVEAVAAGVRDLGIRRLVVDPVIASGQGDILLSADGITALTTLLLPLATVVTPNLAEAASLAGVGEITDRAGMEEAARALAALGPAVIMITGGHLTDDPGSPDLVFSDGTFRWVEGGRLPGPNSHGSGCVLSAAIAAELARGSPAIDACVAAKRFTKGAIDSAVDLGAGPGPVDPGSHRDRL